MLGPSTCLTLVYAETAPDRPPGLYSFAIPGLYFPPKNPSDVFLCFPLLITHLPLSKIKDSREQILFRVKFKL
jgi:hypothetical protein